ncbi:hypothetical protein BC940DRAFT_345609 [Gongronella butleri]|nr:hypothetical protein BC940DRAFT_345609 [Gongronella butleri]
MPLSPASPTPKGTVPWHSHLKKSYTKNFLYVDQPILLSMANIKRSGDVSMHCLEFKDFVDDDERFLVFHIALNDTLMGDIKSDPHARLCWTMPKTKEYYKLEGKFYIASAPIQVTRFPPPRLVEGVAAADYWEERRTSHWKKLDDATRATYTWPSRGDAPRAEKQAFACQSLAYYDAKQPANQLHVVHDIAMDNFCLLLYKITEVEHLDYNAFPPKRTLYTVSAKDNQWSMQELNP